MMRQMLALGRALPRRRCSRATLASGREKDHCAVLLQYARRSAGLHAASAGALARVQSRQASYVGYSVFGQACSHASAQLADGGVGGAGGVGGVGGTGEPPTKGPQNPP